MRWQSTGGSLAYPLYIRKLHLKVHVCVNFHFNRTAFTADLHLFLWNDDGIFLRLQDGQCVSYAAIRLVTVYDFSFPAVIRIIGCNSIMQCVAGHAACHGLLYPIYRRHDDLIITIASQFHRNLFPWSAYMTVVLAQKNYGTTSLVDMYRFR